MSQADIKSFLRNWTKENVFNLVHQKNPTVAKTLLDNEFDGDSLYYLLYKDNENSFGVTVGLKYGLKTLIEEMTEIQRHRVMSCEDNTASLTDKENAVSERHNQENAVCEAENQSLGEEEATKRLVDGIKRGDFSLTKMLAGDAFSSLWCHLPSDIFAVLQRTTSISLGMVIVQGSTASLQGSDFIFGAIVLLGQGIVNVSRWFCGDITISQAIKNMAVNTASLVGAGLGTWGGTAAGAAIGVAIGTASAPIIGTVVGGILGAIVGALIFSVTTGGLVEWMFPDGYVEEFIQKRNAMLESLELLGCTEVSSNTVIRKAYRQGLRLYHPDTNGAEQTVELTQKFHAICLAYKIILGYRGLIDNFKKELHFHPDDSIISPTVNENVLKLLKALWETIKSDINKRIEELNKLPIEELDLQSDSDSDSGMSSELSEKWKQRKKERNEIRHKNRSTIRIREISDVLKFKEDRYRCLKKHYIKRGVPKNRIRKAFDWLTIGKPKITEIDPDAHQRVFGLENK